MNSNITANDIIKAYDYCINHDDCDECVCVITNMHCIVNRPKLALDLINSLKSEKEKLEYILMGVMHSVDKWLEGDELKHDETNRAVIMREKTLQIIENQQAEIERLNKEIDRLHTLSSTFGELAIKTICEKVCAPTPTESHIVEKCIETIYNLIQEI